MHLAIEHNSVSKDTKELFSLCFSQDRRDVEWSWKYQKSPQGFSAARCYDNEKLICQYGGIKYSCFINNKEYKIFQIIDVMTHPKYRNGWIMIKTVQKFFEYCCQKVGSPFIYGFNTAVARKLGMKRLNYYSETPISYLQKKVNSKKNLSLNSSVFKIERVNSFKEETSDIYKEQLNYYSIVLKKDKNYLDWRYLNTPFKYSIFSCNQKVQNNFYGYIIIKEEFDKAYLVDILLKREAQDKLDIFLTILEKEYLHTQKIITLESWCSKKDPYYQKLMNFKFKPLNEPRNLYFTCRPFSGVSDGFFIDEHFFYTMGDSDLF
ncbi:MAG: GNAT family N-acetyltransferase [Candidatus Omnitrophica bacterium]|jgi:predicted acetyltransferase|nr:GNAT family N-acetyltransferase [Candidatus Omnitrophota bacterium]